MASTPLVKVATSEVRAVHGEIPLIPGTEGQLELEKSRLKAELRQQGNFEFAKAKSERLTKKASSHPGFRPVARQARYDARQARQVLDDPVSVEPPSDLVPVTAPLKIKQLIQLNAVTCGVSNVSTIDIFNENGSIIHDFFKITPAFLRYLNRPHSLEEWEWYVNILRQILIFKNDPYLKKIVSKSQVDMSSLSEPEKQHFKSIQDYVHSKDKSYEVHTFKEGDLIINKTFSKLTPSELTETDPMYVNKIFAYNANIDILELLEQYGYRGPITLFDIIDFLHGFGVDTIILVDFSCGVFSYNDKIITNGRFIRKTRRSLGGKKTKRKKQFYKHKL